MGYREVYEYSPVYSVYPGFMGVSKDVRGEWKVYIDQLKALNVQLRRGAVSPETPEPAPPSVEGAPGQVKTARDVSQAIVNARQIARNLAAAAAASADTSAYVRGTIPGYRSPTSPLPSVEPGVFVDTTVPDASAGDGTAPGIPSPIQIPSAIPFPLIGPAVVSPPAGFHRDVARAPDMMDPTEPSVSAPSGGMGKWIIGGAVLLGIGAVLMMRRRKNPPRRRRRKARR